MSWKKKFKKVLEKFKKADPLLGKVIERSAIYKDDGSFDFKQSLSKFKQKTDLFANDRGQDPLEASLGIAPGGIGGLAKSNDEVKAISDAKALRESGIHNLNVSSPYTGGAQMAASAPLRTSTGELVYGDNSQITDQYKGLLAKKIRRP
jgi:hypothetical protein